MLVKTLEAKGAVLIKQRKALLHISCNAWFKRVALTGNTCGPVCSPASPPAGPAGPLSQHMSRGGVVWWSFDSAPELPPTLLPAAFVYCLDGGGDWINKAVKSRNGTHGKRLRALKSSFIFSPVWSKNASCTEVVPGDYNIRGALLLDACHSLSWKEVSTRAIGEAGDSAQPCNYDANSPKVRTP